MTIFTWTPPCYLHNRTYFGWHNIILLGGRLAGLFRLFTCALIWVLAYFSASTSIPSFHLSVQLSNTTCSTILRVRVVDPLVATYFRHKPRVSHQLNYTEIANEWRSCFYLLLRCTQASRLLANVIGLDVWIRATPLLPWNMSSVSMPVSQWHVTDGQRQCVLPTPSSTIHSKAIAKYSCTILMVCWLPVCAQVWGELDGNCTLSSFLCSHHYR